MRGIILIQMHIAQQAGARITPFQQIVAENPVLGKAFIQCLLECIHLIDTLADERTFAEHVLVDVGDDAGIGVDAGVHAMQSRIARAVGAFQAHADARLKNAVARADPLPLCVVARAIQRMRHGAHKLPCDITRKLRIRVQGDDVLYIRETSRITGNERETVAGIAAQQCIQVRKLATLALVAHPDPLLRIPAARAMKKEKNVIIRSTIFCVQRLDFRLGQPQQRLVLGERFFLRVQKISQQPEIQIVVPISQKAHFQCLDQVVDILRTGEHRRNHDQRARLRRNAGGKIHARQRMRAHQQGHQPIHQGQRQLTGRQQCKQAYRCPHFIRHALGLRQQARAEQQREQRDRAEIQTQWASGT